MECFLSDKQNDNLTRSWNLSYLCACTDLVWDLFYEMSQVSVTTQDFSHIHKGCEHMAVDLCVQQVLLKGFLV